MTSIEVQLDGSRIVIIWRSQPDASERSEPDVKGPPERRALPAPTHTAATSLFIHESELIRRLRKRLAETFKLPVDHRFFSESYLPGETPNEALLRMFKRLQWMVSLTDDQAIESMAKVR